MTTSRSIGALIAVGLHLVAGAALLSDEPTRPALFAAAPIMVDLITPPQPRPQPEPPVEIVPPKPKSRPKPKPKPVVKPRPKPPKPKPVIAAPAEAPSPSPVFTAPAPPQPAPAPEPAPAPASVVAASPALPAVVPVTPPVFNAAYLNNPPPAYPSLSRRFGEEGRLVLRVLVSALGAADEVQIHESSGHQRLDEAAHDTVRRWKFVPAKRGGQPIAAWVLIPISFKLKG